MEILEEIKDIAMHPGAIVFIALTLVEISPIKINPWKAILKWIGNVLLGEIREDITELKTDFEQTKAQDKRWCILNFASSCRKGELHSREEWKHAISELKEYEAYTEEKGIENGVIEEDAKYLRELYHERNVKNDFV